MPALELSVTEAKILRCVMQNMDTLPDVDYQAVADQAGIKYAKNAKANFKKLFLKLKTEGGRASDEVASGDEKEVDEPKKEPIKKAAAKATKAEKADEVLSGDEMNVEVPKKAVAKRSASKAAPKAPVKKSVGKSVAPIKAGAGGPKAKVPARKGKKKGDEEPVAATTYPALVSPSMSEGDGDMEGIEDGKSLTPPPPVRLDAARVVTPKPTLAARVHNAVASYPEVEPYEVSYVESPAPVFDDYEAYIRGMTLQEWLAFKEANAINIVEII